MTDGGSSPGRTMRMAFGPLQIFALLMAFVGICILVLTALGVVQLG